MAPLLFREVSGEQDPLRDLRETAVAAVRDLAAAHDRLLALCPVGPVGAPAAYHRGPVCAPLSVLVARHLLDLAGSDVALTELEVSGPDVQVDLDGGIGLLVLGDGTARRSTSAPGYLDERGFGVDDEIGAALEAGDGEALAHLDQGLAEALMMTGRHTFRALGRSLPTAIGEVRWRGDPFGVTYWVATWS